jgi:hypothetical protein
VRDLLPGCVWLPSPIEHDARPATYGLTIHWTAGSRGGDIGALTGGHVDCLAYVPKAPPGPYQFLDPDEQSWHAFPTANHFCIGIEHEGSGEPWTAWQFDQSAKLAAYLCRRYSIPIRHADPSGHDLSTFRGIFGHRDLSLGGERVDGNDHTDSVPSEPGWSRYLLAVTREFQALENPVEEIDLGKLPNDGSLRLVVGGRLWAGWYQAADPLRWVARNGAKDPDAAIAWDGNVWRGPEKVTAVARNLVRRFLT